MIMEMKREKSLAWAMLSHKKMHFALSITGIAFAVLLMFVEIGFLNGLLDSETLLANNLDADLIVMNRKKTYAYALAPFPRQRLARALDVPGVEAARGFYMHWVRVRNTEARKIHDIMCLAYDTAFPALLIPEARRLGAALKYPRTALFDRTSRTELYGGIPPGTEVELEDRQVRFIGEFTLRPNFSTDGHVLMDVDNLARLLKRKETGLENIRDTPEIGLIRLSPGADAQKVIQALDAHLLDDVRVVTKEEMIRRIKEKWKSDQPVVQVFGLGLIVGFTIGMIICYQILFTDISDHSAEFATLKAIGYSNAYLIRTVVTQGFYLALAAFGPGLLASFVFYTLLQHMTGIWMRITVYRAAGIFALTLIMCVVSAYLAARKVTRMDPAEVF